MATLKMSKLTEKYQATIPAEVRSALKLQKGDSISFEVGEGKVSPTESHANGFGVGKGDRKHFS